MKNITIMLILASLILATACGGEPVSNDTTVSDDSSTPTEEKGEYDYPDINLRGEKFSILNTGNDYGFYSNIEFEKETGDILDDAVYRRNRKAEELLGFKLDVTEYTLNDTHTHLQTMVLAGDDVYDVAFLHDIRVGALINQNCFISLESVNGFNFDKPWWDREVIETATTVLNGLYFALTDFSLVDFEGTIVTYFNKQLFDDNKLDAPYQLVKDEKWTLDEMNKLATAGARLNGDESWTQNANGKSVYGLTTWNGGLDAFLTGGDIDFLSTDGDKIKFGLNNEHFFDVVDKIFTLFNAEGTFELLDPSRGGAYTLHHEVAFKSGRSLMNVAELKASSSLRDMNDDFGILPMPKFDENQENYSNFRGFSYVMCIPVTNEEADTTAAVMDLMSYLTYKEVIPAFYDGKLSSKQLRDTESVEMLDIIRETRKYEPAVIFDWLNNTRYRIRDVLISKNNTFASEIESMNDSITAQLEALAK